MQHIFFSQAITLENLDDPNYLEWLRGEVMELNRGREIGTSLDILRQLQLALATAVNLPLYSKQKWEEVLTLLKAASFSLLDGSEQQELLRNHAIEFIHMNFEEPKAPFYLLSMSRYQFEDGPEWRPLMEGLNTAIQAIGTQNIIVGGKLSGPVIKNWLVDYNLSQPIKDHPRGRVEEIQYITQSSNAQKLTQNEKELLLKVLEVYDWLRYPHTEVAEETITRMPPRRPVAVPSAPRQFVPPRPPAMPSRPTPPPSPRPVMPPPPSFSRVAQMAPPPPRPAPPPVHFTQDITPVPKAKPIFPKPLPSPPAPEVAPAPEKFTRDTLPAQLSKTSEDLDKLLHEASFKESVSLSQAIANADQGTVPEGEINMSKAPATSWKAEKSSKISDDSTASQKIVSPIGKPVPPKPPASDRPSRDGSQGGPASPPAWPVGRAGRPVSPKPSQGMPVPPQKPASPPPQLDRVIIPKAPAVVPQWPFVPEGSVIQPRTATPPSKPAVPASPDFDGELSRTAGRPVSPSSYPSSIPPYPKGENLVVDLAKRVPLDLGRISSVVELEKIQLTDLKSTSFDSDLAQIKHKINELASKLHVPTKNILNSFYRSPLYNLYMAMAVALMNDTGTDQKAAFEKVVNNYRMAKKEFLTEAQFASLGRFKKELAALG